MDSFPNAPPPFAQCGARSLAIHKAAAHGLYGAPDPSRQMAYTIGGNVAKNAGTVIPTLGRGQQREQPVSPRPGT